MAEYVDCPLPEDLDPMLLHQVYLETCAELGLGLSGEDIAARERIAAMVLQTAMAGERHPRVIRRIVMLRFCRRQ